MSAFATCLAAALTLSAAPDPRPSATAVKRAVEVGGRAWVRVWARGSAPGVLVGADGQVLTVGTLVHGDSALVEINSAPHSARLVQRLPTLGLVLLAVDGDGPFRAPGARVEPPVAGEWVVGLGEAGATPALGQVTRAPPGPWFEISLRLPPGSPVLDRRGKLLGIVTERRRASARAAAIPAVRAELHPEAAGR